MASHAERLKKLIAASQILAQTESASELLPRLLMLAQEVTDASASSILMHKPETEMLEFALAMNEDKVVAEKILGGGIALRVGEGIAGHVARERKAVLVADVQSDARFSSATDKVTGFVTRDMLCAPILYKDELLGVVQVLNAKDKACFDHEDMDVLESFAHLAAVALIRSKWLGALLRQERFQVQLDAAARIQSHFLPKLPETGRKWSVWAETKPAITVGGDMYDCIPAGPDLWLLSVADVSGKGLPAALVGAALWAALRSATAASVEPGEIMSTVNREMFGLLGHRMFITMALCAFSPSTGTGTTCLAGHPPPLVVQSGEVTNWRPETGPPLGLDEDAVYPGNQIQLGKGDSILLYSDGVTEARNEEREFFGEDRLKECATGAIFPRGPALLRALEEWRQGVEPNDDVTILEICGES
jgi:phosphoserine phosphatase RsbU/P